MTAQHNKYGVSADVNKIQKKNVFSYLHLEKNKQPLAVAFNLTISLKQKTRVGEKGARRTLQYGNNCVLI